MLTLTAETHLRVTPKGFVNLLCGTCDYRLTVEQASLVQEWRVVPCRNCGEGMCMDGNLTFDVRADHELLLTTTPTVWYHVTTRKTLSFWRVELSDEAQANTKTTIYRDDNDWPDFYQKSWGDPKWPVKYVNRFELPGSISLLTEFKHLASVERIPDETAKSMFQYDPKKEFSE